MNAVELGPCRIPSRPEATHTRARSTLLTILAVTTMGITMAQTPNLMECPDYSGRPADASAPAHHRCLDWLLGASSPTTDTLAANMPYIVEVLNDTSFEAGPGLFRILRAVESRVASPADRSSMTWLLLDHGGDPFLVHAGTNAFQAFVHDDAIAATLVAWATAGSRSGPGVAEARATVGPSWVQWAEARTGREPATLGQADTGGGDAPVAVPDQGEASAVADEPGTDDGSPDDPLSAHRLARSGTLADIRAAVASGMTFDGRDPYGQTPLMYASGSNSPAVVAALLRRPEVDPNAQSASGWTALHFAVRDNVDADVVITLLDGGADANLTNDDGQTPPQLARALDRTLAAQAFVTYEARIREQATAAAAAAARESAEAARAMNEVVFWRSVGEDLRDVIEPSVFPQPTGSASGWIVVLFGRPTAARVYVANVQAGEYCRWEVNLGGTYVYPMQLGYPSQEALIRGERHFLPAFQFALGGPGGRVVSLVADPVNGRCFIREN